MLYAIDTRVRSAVDDAIRHGISTDENFKRDFRTSIRHNFARAAGKTLAVESLYTESEDVPEGISREKFAAIEREGLLCFQFRDAPLSETYEAVCRLECYLHDYIRRALLHEFRAAWWLDGIPENIRLECVERQRRELSSTHPYG